MSQRAGSHSQHADHGRRAHPHGAAAGYTLAHAGRQVRFGPVAFWIVVGTVVIMGAWSITTATYFAFRDSVLARLISRQSDMQVGYEDREPIEDVLPLEARPRLAQGQRLPSSATPSPASWRTSISSFCEITLLDPSTTTRSIRFRSSRTLPFHGSWTRKSRAPGRGVRA